jgi:pimeloyl-ACP methyl ester carboxylesterase
VPELAQHFHVFRPDRRGHGRTPTSRAPSPMRSWPRTPSPSSNRSSAAQPTCWATATGHPWRC